MNVWKLETRNLKLLFYSLCVLFSFPSCHALDREAFTFTEYSLKINVDPPKQFLSATGTITLRNDSQTSQHVAVLQITSSLNWKSIAVGNKPVQYVTHGYTSDIDHTGELSEAVVTLSKDVPPKGTVQLEVAYEGTIVQDSTRLERIGTPKDVALANDWDQISETFTAVRGVGYVAWYPVAMEAASLTEGDGLSATLEHWKERHADSQFSLGIATGGDASAGAPVMLSNREDCSTGHDLLGLTYAAHFTCSKTLMGPSPPFLVAAKYKTVSIPHGVIYSLDKTESPEFAAAAASAAQLVASWFGPLRGNIAVLDLPVKAASYESGTYLFMSLKKTETKLVPVMLAHQFTHASVDSRRPWMYEGLAHFAQVLMREKQDGRQAALDYMGQQRSAIVDDEKENLAIAQAAQSGPNPSIAYTSLVAGNDELLYRSKAMYVWWMLRDMFGDSVLQRTLAKYRPDADKEPAYLQHLLETEAKAAGISGDLEWFFDDWVYRDRGLPDFRVASTYVRPVLGTNQSANAFLATVTIENLGNAGAEVPVTVTAGNKERITKRLLVRAHDKASIRITMQNRPDTVTVNDGSVPESDMANNSAPVRSTSSESSDTSHDR